MISLPLCDGILIRDTINHANYRECLSDWLKSALIMSERFKSLDLVAKERYVKRTIGLDEEHDPCAANNHK